jgi:hypothetical protein
MTVVADVCFRIDRRPLAEELINARNRYEASPEYPNDDEG